MAALIALAGARHGDHDGAPIGVWTNGGETIILHRREQRLALARGDKKKQDVEAEYDNKRPHVPDRPGIADAFRDFPKRQTFAFVEEEE